MHEISFVGTVEETPVIKKQSNMDRLRQMMALGKPLPPADPEAVAAPPPVNEPEVVAEPVADRMQEPPREARVSRRAAEAEVPVPAPVKQDAVVKAQPVIDEPPAVEETNPAPVAEEGTKSVSVPTRVGQKFTAFKTGLKTDRADPGIATHARYDWSSRLGWTVNLNRYIQEDAAGGTLRYGEILYHVPHHDKRLWWSDAEVVAVYVPTATSCFTADEYADSTHTVHQFRLPHHPRGGTRWIAFVTTLEVAYDQTGRVRRDAALHAAQRQGDNMSEYLQFEPFNLAKLIKSNLTDGQRELLEQFVGRNLKPRVITSLADVLSNRQATRSNLQA